jgi:hypothetical protein
VTERSNIEGHWDDFADWCEDEGVSLEDRVVLWTCWNAALDAREAAEAAGGE